MREEIIVVPTGNEFVTFESTDSAVAKKYTSIGDFLVVRIKNAKMSFSIDFGVGDVIVQDWKRRNLLSWMILKHLR